ncbi:hypothetical protein P691DRAFT_2960 [Macrolepiota fuliginosa MF-IS2]|uniref:Uncharacterized protein n=1 Tax=Macrolepiota fuliginosa MF-IS2 TaxID=1400762 RepID=A0A9P5XNS5_9AGAR|nr:hypothetical protein P691DRAFT_2960 [Macrolepiota fuliginosa MF-IS2]
MTETSPLLIPPPRAKPRIGIHGHGQQRKRRCYCSDCGIPSRRRLSPEKVDEIFGKWPNRMLNYQWWWWNAEAVVCCQCLDESDDESY